MLQSLHTEVVLRYLSNVSNNIYTKVINRGKIYNEFKYKQNFNNKYILNTFSSPRKILKMSNTT